MSTAMVHAVGEAPEWEELDMVVGSGASVTVINNDMVRAVDASGARPEVRYQIADGSLIENMGQKHFTAKTIAGTTHQLAAQVTDVNKALLSVVKTVNAGNRVVFDEAHRYIEDKSNGNRIPIERKNGAYVLNMRIPRNHSSPF